MLASMASHESLENIPEMSALSCFPTKVVSLLPMKAFQDHCASSVREALNMYGGMTPSADTPFMAPCVRGYFYSPF